MIPMNLNTNTYVIAIDNTSKAATLTPQDTNQSSLVLYNGSDKAVFVVSSESSMTAVFPTSATVPMAGKVVAPGATVTFTKNIKDKFINAIQASAGTGSLYISVGSGE